jgi:hypothetical protein
MTDKKFQEALQAAKKTVDGWPSWKQNSLLVTTMATTPSPRQPVESRAVSRTDKKLSHGADPHDANKSGS